MNCKLKYYFVKKVIINKKGRTSEFFVSECLYSRNVLQLLTFLQKLLKFSKLNPLLVYYLASSISLYSVNLQSSVFLPTALGGCGKSWCLLLQSESFYDPNLDNHQKRDQKVQEYFRICPAKGNLRISFSQWTLNRNMWRYAHRGGCRRSLCNVEACKKAVSTLKQL